MNTREINENGLLAQGLKEAAWITRRHARTFYFASHFLEREQKNAAYAVYAICRLSDDAVDMPGAGLSQERLIRMRDRIELAYGQNAPDTPLLFAFRHAVSRFDIPKIYFSKLLEGMQMDLTRNRYRNFEELYQYCYHAAGVVGLIMLKIFGYTDPEAELHAVEMGIAMQLTNIARDIREDFQRRRIYLPQDEMQRFQVTESDIAAGKVDDNFTALMRFFIERARDFYLQAGKGIGMIGNRRSRLVALAMQDIYAGILSAIERNKYDVFARRARVDSLGKTTRIAKIFFGGKYL